MKRIILGLVLFVSLGFTANYVDGNDKKGLQQSCDNGEMNGCSNLAVLYREGDGVKQNYFKANELSKKACDDNEQMGCLDLGIAYLRGQGVRQDYRKAKEFSGKACDLGNSHGCSNYKLINERYLK